MKGERFMDLGEVVAYLSELPGDQRVRTLLVEDDTFTVLVDSAGNAPEHLRRPSLVLHRATQEAVMLRIRTDYDAKPIPLRQFDWTAVDDATYDGPPCPVGFGRTEDEAIADLLTDLMEDTVQTHFVTHGSVVSGATKQFCVVGTEKGLVFEADSMVEAIAHAQRLNGFHPIDGDEQTYGRQVREARDAG